LRGAIKFTDESSSLEWLLIEWPEGEAEPTKYWFSTLPAEISFRQLVYFAKLRWRIERDYQDLKQEVGLGHYEWRGWRGFHHHATMCIGVSAGPLSDPIGAGNTLPAEVAATLFPCCVICVNGLFVGVLR
jgi:hypothetical protein